MTTKILTNSLLRNIMLEEYTKQLHKYSNISIKELNENANLYEDDLKNKADGDSDIVSKTPPIVAKTKTAQETLKAATKAELVAALLAKEKEEINRDTKKAAEPKPAAEKKVEPAHKSKEQPKSAAKPEVEKKATPKDSDTEGKKPEVKKPSTPPASIKPAEKAPQVKPTPEKKAVPKPVPAPKKEPEAPKPAPTKPKEELKPAKPTPEKKVEPAPKPKEEPEAKKEAEIDDEKKRHKKKKKDYTATPKIKTVMKIPGEGNKLIIAPGTSIRNKKERDQWDVKNISLTHAELQKIITPQGDVEKKIVTNKDLEKKYEIT